MSKPKEKNKPQGRVSLKGITRRDLAILGALYRYRFLPTGFLHRRFFSQVSIQVAQRRLQKLIGLGLASRRRVFELIDPEHPLKTGFVNVLEPLGGELLGVSDLERLQARNQVSVGTINHFLLTNQFMIELELSCEADGYEISEQRDELELKADYDRVPLAKGGKGVAVIPDTFVAIKTQSRKEPARFLLEIDTGHEKSSVIRRKVRAYLQYFKTGAIFKRFGNHTRVLFIAKTERRAANLAQFAFSAGGRGRFWFGSLSLVCAPNLFNQPVWHVAGRNHKASLLPAPNIEIEKGLPSELSLAALSALA